MPWQEVSPTDENLVGRQYRIVLQMHGPFPNDLGKGLFMTAIRIADRLKGGVQVDWGELEFVPPDSNVAGSRYNPWILIIPYHTTEAQSPTLVIIGVITAAVFALGLVTVGKHTTELFISEVGEGIRNLTKPETLIAFAALGFLVFGRVRG